MAMAVPIIGEGAPKGGRPCGGAEGPRVGLVRPSVSGLVAVPLGGSFCLGFAAQWLSGSVAQWFSGSEGGRPPHGPWPGLVWWRVENGSR